MLLFIKNSIQKSENIYVEHATTSESKEKSAKNKQDYWKKINSNLFDENTSGVEPMRALWGSILKRTLSTIWYFRPYDCIPRILEYSIEIESCCSWSW